MTDQVMIEIDDDSLSREDRVIAKLRQRAEDYARQPPEVQPAMWSVIFIGLFAGVTMLAAGSVVANFLL